MSSILHILCPLFFSLYPVIYLYNYNIDMLTLKQLQIPLVLAILLPLFFYCIFWFIYKSSVQSSLATTVLMVIFWNYSLLFQGSNYLINIEHWHLIPLIFFGYGHLLYFLKHINKKVNLENVNKFLLVMVSALIIINLITLIPGEIQKHGSVLAASRQEVEQPTKSGRNYHEAINYPDVYLLIFDEYASIDVIKEDYGYNNSDFVEFLNENNLFLAENSKVSHPTTIRTLPELLNIRYFEEDRTEAELINLYYDNYLFEYFSSKDYQIVFLNGYQEHRPIPENSTSDLLHITYDDFQIYERSFFVDSFYALLFSRTLVKPFELLLDTDADTYWYHGNLGFFNYLSNAAPKMESPKFVYAHIMSPHLPYVFDRDGNFTRNKTNYWEFEEYDKSELRTMYLEQYIYVTSVIKNIIDSIQKHNDEAIIIIQSDHGPRPTSAGNHDIDDALKIINIIYFPDKDYSGLDHDISPVNTLRVMLNKYFNEDFEMLEDR